MPRPPILPTIDWPQIWSQATDFKAWLKRADNAQVAEAMSEQAQQLSIPSNIRSALEGLDRTVYICCIAEDWCGDVRRHVPPLQALSKFDEVQVRYLFREDCPEVFVRFLTNGGEAIPKMIFLSDAWVETGNWGPMPNACRELISQGKAAADVGAARKLVSAAYQNDPGCLVVLEELSAAITLAATTQISAS